MLVLPISKDGDIQWKIWILTTYLQDLDLHPENEALLQQPGRDLKDIKNVDSDVLIIGAGNAYVIRRICKIFVFIVLIFILQSCYTCCSS